MIFTHWTHDASWRPDTARSYVQPYTHDPARHPEECYGVKPEGLWLSLDEGGRGWRQWASENMSYKIGDYAVQVEVDVSSLLVGDPFLTESLLSEQGGCWQWEWVARQYAGCLIYAGSKAPPYPPSSGDRLSYPLMWISGWDCDSACVWDMKVIQHVGAFHSGRK